MSNFRNIGSWVCLGALLGVTAVACGNDVDVLTPNTAGAGGGNGTAGASGSGGDSGSGGTAGSGGGTVACTESMEITVDSGEITADTEWPSCAKVTIKENTFVFVRNGATLKIGAGATIMGESQTAIVIDEGGKIEAVGTKEQPIVMTAAGSNRKPGAWGGLVIVGKAHSNNPNGVGDAEGFASANVKYGGGQNPINDDSSGTLKYVRVEFAGFQISDGNELNAVTFYGVGSGTVVEHVQAHFGQDDGFEWFGGTVNAKYLLATGIGDDCFDWDRGWTGKAQFLGAVQDELQPGDNGVESDNRKGGTADVPFTSPTVYNMTLVGKKDSGHGMLFKEGSKATIRNALVYGFQKSCLKVQGTQTAANAGDGSLSVENSILGCASNFEAAGDDFDEKPWAEDANRNNKIVAGGEVKISGESVTAVNMALPAGSPALDGGAVPTDEFFDKSATFMGACGTDCSEFSGWTAFPVK